MLELETLDIIALLQLLYQADSNEQLRHQANNDDILNEISDFAEKLTKQNERIIALLECLCKKQEN